MKRYKRTEEVTLMQAIAEMYDFHPKSHKKVLVFDIVDENGDIISRIGTFWSRWDKQSITPPIPLKGMDEAC